MGVFPPGRIFQENALIPAVEHALLADLHSGHPFSVHRQFLLLYLYLQRHYSSGFSALLEQLQLTPCLKLDEQAAL